MLVLFWLLTCLMTLCCGQGKIQDARFPAMKEPPLLMRRVHRAVRAVGSCRDINSNLISNGKYFVPSGKNPCLHCKCVSGQPQKCVATKCAVPTCPDYKAVDGQCCEYTCPEERTDGTQLAVIIGLSLGLLILVILLIVVIVRNVKKNRGYRATNQNLEEQAPLNNRLPAIREEQQERTFEPPPPYTPVRNVNKCKTQHQLPNPQVIPNEPPPPYEIQRNLRATTV
ncbi:integral membrane protein DGCR2/IDD-like isoform X2 [Actinia tenebrosa]|uniref:Integral membrane protein DGCR2/IDD-like isoform X2 n=1 Tax=Actinia tenebrosa TaxID=6105 RepID=A0A6P8HQI0_ACTTE|nr:integral membrane protein DGCR2/IDD-like isoform X2 [Actinia tenebrosa]